MAEPQQNRKKGCLPYVIFATVVLLIGACFGLLYHHWMVNHLTDTQPMTLPSVKLPDLQMFQLHDRVDTFQEDVRDGEPTEPLVLSADELNALIETDPLLASLKLKDHLYVSIKGDQLSAQISFPAADLGLARLRGRYINATGDFHVALTNGELIIMAKSLSVKGEPVPGNIMREIASENLAERFNDDPRAAAGLKKLKSIDVKDGKLVIAARKPGV